MVGLSVGGAKRYLIAFAALIAITLAAVAFFPRGSSLEAARDYEECVEAIMANQSSPASGDEHNAAMTGCNARFAGRRKPGGGYSYYDFMQNRSFDIAGPNPTAEERKQIDREYIAIPGRSTAGSRFGGTGKKTGRTAASGSWKSRVNLWGRRWY